MSYRVIPLPREVLPRIENGVDYSAERWLLVSYKSKRVFWVRAGKCWKNKIEGYQPIGGRLIMQDTSNSKDYGKEIHSGGRLTKGLLLHYERVIGDFLDVPMRMPMESMSPNVTVQIL